MIRTVRLGLFLLVCLAALASYRIAFNSPYPVQPTNPPALPNPVLLGAPVDDSRPESLTKGDRLEVAPLQSADFLKPAAAMAITAPAPGPSPATPEPRIVSRHWHDPSSPALNPAQARFASQNGPQNGPKKRSAVTERKPVMEAGACASGGVDTLRKLFNLPPNCASN